MRNGCDCTTFFEMKKDCMNPKFAKVSKTIGENRNMPCFPWQKFHHHMVLTLYYLDFFCPEQS